MYDFDDYAGNPAEIELARMPELQHIFAALEINRRLIPAVLDAKNPFRLMMERSAEEADIALDALLEADIIANPTAAAALQAKVLRHRDMIRWIEQFVTIGDQAAHEARENGLSEPESNNEDHVQ